MDIGEIVIFLFFFFFLLIIASFIFWIVMIVDCAKRNFKNKNEKLVWIIILALLNIIGALIYYFIVRKNVHTKVSEKIRFKNKRKKKRY